MREHISLSVRLRRAILLAILAAAFCPALAYAQAPEGSNGRRFEGPPRNPHLVGHEEAELLKRIQELIDDHDPRRLVNPYVETVADPDHPAKPTLRKAFRQPALLQFIADVDAAEALGKAFFWEMQAGSDFRRQIGRDGEPVMIGTACASCHFRFGADPRDTNTRRIPYVAWDQYGLDSSHNVIGHGETPKPYDAAESATHKIKDFRELLEPRNRVPDPPRRGRPDDDEEGDDEDDDNRPRTPLSLIIGSQGVEPRVFMGLNAGNSVPPGNGPWESEYSAPRDPSGFQRPPQWTMFLLDRTNPNSRAFRQITTRNSPSVLNSVFADRLFHDVRAESTFNGFSIFGDFDRREVIHVRKIGLDGKPLPPVPVHVAIPRAALASQAVGPVVNDVEMSYVGRTFHDLAAKLLDAPVLGYQVVSPDDSHLGRFRDAGLAAQAPGLGLKYRDLIRRAFRREWWDGAGADGHEQDVELRLAIIDPAQSYPKGTLMEANFSLYWGLSLLLYQATLVSNDSPFDRMMRGRPEAVEEVWQIEKSRFEPILADRARNTARRPGAAAGSAEPTPDAAPLILESGAEVFQRGLRAFRSRGCVDCHDGPLFSELYTRDEVAEFGPIKSLPIAKQVHDTLLPNSRADAITFAFQNARERVLARVLAVVAEQGNPTVPTRRELMDYAEALDRSGGDQAELERSVGGLLRSSRLAPAENETPEQQATREARIVAQSQVIARHWMPFEKTFARFLGRRPFFREDERVAIASLLTAPLFVEQMLFGKAVAEHRPIWPILGPKARGSYAFYDTGVYNLGVAPPRYDSGVGAWTDGGDRPTVYTEPMLREFETFLDRLLVALNAAPAAESAGLVERQVREFDIQTHRKFRLIMSKAVRQAVREAAVPLDGRAERLAGLKRLSAEKRGELSLPAPGTVQKKWEAAPPQTVMTGAVVGSRSQTSAGAPGRAYRLDPQKARPESIAPDAAKAPEAPVRQAGALIRGPWVVASDADAEERASNPRDLSWFRNLPNWDGDPALGGAAGGPFDSLDRRRADVHFFSRSRAVVQDESPEGRRKPFLHDNELAFWGAFKTPTLRNVALTAPYMHNGRIQTLFDVLDFYDRGGDVRPDRELNPDLAPQMARLGMDEEEKLAVVFFLMTLTDPRVSHERAPFDHPSLVVVNGYEKVDSGFSEKTIAVKPVGAGGRSGIPRTFPSGDDSEHEPRAAAQP